MIHFRMLGEIRLTGADGTELDALLRQPKRLALLGYLASPAPGTWHRRDMVLALFWPELDTARARTSLRNALYVLRQALGEETIRNRGDEEISVDNEKLSTDVAMVWDALRDQRIDDALKYYGGDLLPGLFPADSDGFQRWLDSERTRLKVSVSGSAIERLNDLEREGNLKQALVVARRIMEIQPDDETVVRRLMSVYDEIGDRAGGLQVFETYRAKLASDFDAHPAPQTLALAARMREAAEISPSGASAPVKKPSAETRAASPAADQLPEAATSPLPYRRRRSRGRWWATTVVVTAIVTAAIAAWRLSGPAKPPSIGASTPLTTDEGLQVEAALSPNGRFVAYAKGNPNRLRIFVQKIGGGAPWPLSPDSNEIELVPRFAPDNDEILFLANNNAYASPVLGGSRRLVARGTEGDGMIHSASWSPSGDSVAIVRRDSLIVKPVEGTGSRFVGKAYQLHSCVWSPDGKWIACVSGNVLALTPGPLFGNEAQSAVVVFPAAGGKPIDITGNAYEHKSPAWTSDGKFLCVLSNRDGVSGQAYSIEIGSNGVPVSPFVPLGFTAEWMGIAKNRVAYSVPVRKANLWTVPVQYGKVLTFASAKQITSGNQVIELVSISRDRKWLVYDSNLRGNADIYRMPADGGNAERLTTDDAPEYAAELSPDGREIAYHKWLKGERRLFVKQLDDDREQEIKAIAGDAGVPRWSPDGNSIVAWSHKKEAGGVFLLRRDGGGTWRKVWQLNVGQLPVWSPDGKTIAFVLLDGSIQTIPKDSGEMRAVYTPRPGTSDPIATYLAWRGTGTTIWFVGHDPSGNSGFYVVPLKTGVARLLVRLDIPNGATNGPAFAFDGRRFFFGVNERLSNVRWAQLTTRR